MGRRDEVAQTRRTIGMSTSQLDGAQGMIIANRAYLVNVLNGFRMGGVTEVTANPVLDLRRLGGFVKVLWDEVRPAGAPSYS